MTIFDHHHLTFLDETILNSFGDSFFFGQMLHKSKSATNNTLNPNSKFNHVDFYYRFWNYLNANAASATY